MQMHWKNIAILPNYVGPIKFMKIEIHGNNSRFSMIFIIICLRSNSYDLGTELNRNRVAVDVFVWFGTLHV